MFVLFVKGVIMTTRIRKKEALLGVVPIGKFVFSHEDAVKQKKKIFKKLDDLKVKYTAIEDTLPDGMVRDQKHVDLVVEDMKKKQIDALFIPHCNFGTEGAAAMIAKKLNVPTLLWAPRDEAPLPDGSRLRDSLCGMFATSKVLHKLKVPFTYIENCRIDEDIFKNGLIDFVRSATLVKVLKTMKLAQIGVRIDFFWTTIINESELLDKFGIEVLPVDIYDFLVKVKARAGKERSKYKEELIDIKKWLEVEGLSSDEPLINTLALRDELEDLANTGGLDAISIKSFTSIQDALGGGCGLAYSQLCDDFPIIEESDIHGAVTSVILEAASHNDLPSFFPDITIRHPENDNAVLLWHASAPLSLKDPDSKIKMAPPWILKGLPPVSLQFKLMDGPLTLARFDGDDGCYRLGCGEGHTVPGPHTNEFYAWMETDNWPRWEKTIMQGPYIHHSSVVYDHCADVLEEACKYIPHLDIERFDKK